MRTTFSHITGRRALGRLALVALLFVGGAGAAMADTVVVDGNTIADGWTNGGATGFTASTGKITSVSLPFLTTTEGQLSTANGYTWYSIVSDDAVTVPEGTIDVAVKAFNNYGGELIVRYSADKSEWINAADITTEIRSNDAMAAFNTQTITGIPEGNYYLQIIGKAIYINSVVIKGEAAAATTPVLNVSPSSIAFGSLRTDDTQTITVSNTGVGSMDVTIASDNTTDFTLSATELTAIGEGESKTFDITFHYDAANLGEKTASITVTPSYNAEEAKTINVTATAADINVWEDFSEGIPATWYNEKGSWLNYVSGLNGYASPGYNSNDILRTPRLYAEEGQALGFDVKIAGKYSSNVVTACYSTDRVNWSDKVTYSADGTYSIIAPATGYYWVQFTASQAGIDNMTGWKIAEAIHDTQLRGSKTPTLCYTHGTYTATVSLAELGGSDETLTAELYFGDDKVAEQTDIALNGNRDITITLEYLPTETFSGDVYIKVYGDNIGTLETDKVAVEISETPYVFDEDSSDNPVISTSSVVKVKYTAQQGWNTIIMPFSLTGSPSYMNTIFGEGWKAYALSSYADGTLALKSTTYMAATTPFLVYAPNAEAHPDGVYLQNVSAGSYSWGKTTEVTKGDATFKGTFAPIAAPDMEGKYVIAADGSFAQMDATASLKAYHAYIVMAEGAALKTITIDGENIEGTTTDLSLVRLLPVGGSDVYTLSGQKVQRAQKGIYIVNGRKVVIK